MPNIFPIFVYVLVFFSLILGGFSTYQVIKLKKLRKTLLKSPGFLSQEEWLNKIIQDIHSLNREFGNLEIDIRKIQDSLQNTVQQINLSKYNSLPTDGGNFSFSLSFLNPKKTGIIITSLYGRDYSRIFVKNILEGKPETPLTQEENRLLETFIYPTNLNYLEPEK